MSQFEARRAESGDGVLGEAASALPTARESERADF